MAIAASNPTFTVDLGQGFDLIFNFTFSGNYTTGGESLSGIFTAMNFKSTHKPEFLTITSLTGRYFYIFDYTNNKVLVFDSNTQAEIAQAGYPAAVSNDTVRVRGLFRKLI